MFQYTVGDILASDAEALVNTVNCVGIMGRGIALQFKNAFPENFKAYEIACRLHRVTPGQMFVFENNKLHQPRLIINFPTKRHWRGKSRMEDIDSGLTALAGEIARRRIRSIAIPPLGSGLGGLDWNAVRPRIESALGALPGLHISIYEPSGAPSAREMIASSDVPEMTSGRAALVVLMDRYLSGLLDPFISLLELHKLMYFMQEAGQNLKLEFRQALYGPYAERLRHVLRAIEGHFIYGYADGGDNPAKELEVVPGAVQDAKAHLQADIAALHRLDRVAELVEGFETPFGLELLSTVHWVAMRTQARTLEEVVEQTHSWNERKKRFDARQIELALEALRNKHWLSGLSS